MNQNTDALFAQAGMVAEGVAGQVIASFAAAYADKMKGKTNAPPIPLVWAGSLAGHLGAVAAAAYIANNLPAPPPPAPAPPAPAAPADEAAPAPKAKK